MATRRIPKLAEADYPQWQRIFGSTLPETFSLWMASADRHYRDGGTGHEDVPVDPLEFEAYCRAAGIAPDPQALDDYAHKLADDRPRPSRGTMTGRVDP